MVAHAEGADVRLDAAVGRGARRAEARDLAGELYGAAVLARPRGFFAVQSVVQAAKVQADLVLPRTHALDDAGTIVATDGRVCELRPGGQGAAATWWRARRRSRCGIKGKNDNR